MVGKFFKNLRILKKHFVRDRKTLVVVLVLQLLFNVLLFATISFFPLRQQPPTLCDPHPNPATNLAVVPTEYSALTILQEDLPNLPAKYFKANRTEFQFYGNNSCAKFPSIYDLEFTNMYWQTLHHPSGFIAHLYSAFLDKRKSPAVVRILTMLNEQKPRNFTLYCQLWFEGFSQPVIVPTSSFLYLNWHSKGINPLGKAVWPHFINCSIPPSFSSHTPAIVSVVSHFCKGATNLLKVTYNKCKTGKKKKFGVCVRELNLPYTDISVQLIEWVELMHILGADTIFMYPLFVHPNVTRVLNYYKSNGMVQTVPYSLSGGQLDMPSMQHLFNTKRHYQYMVREAVSLCDCFYRHIYEYEYIVIIDVDEVIMPLKANSWFEIIATMEKTKPKAAAYVSWNSYFFTEFGTMYGFPPEIPQYMKILRNIYKTTKYGSNTNPQKSFQSTEYTLVPHNHRPLRCLTSGCKTYRIHDAQTQHYKSECQVTLHRPCNATNITIDTTAWRFKEALLKKTHKAGHDVGIL